ncbi:MAG TPA: TIGR00730 family Rossman fold protein [Rhodospirillales bacterium]|nr:TIGR00730 family Rossman fold protein [Rhodospirillales bacterium]
MTEISSVCVFCGSRAGNDLDHGIAARALGQEIAKRKVRLIYGGGDIGLMSMVARGALEAGGLATGIIPRFIMEFEVGNPGLTELIVVESMHERKRTMFDMSDGFVVLPGGLGTLDEFIEILTWKQLQQHSKPVVLLNINNYWQPMLELIAAVAEGGFGHHGIADLFSVVDAVDAVFPALASAPDVSDDVLTSHL